MSGEKSCIVVVCGIPASGKTTFIELITNFLSSGCTNGSTITLLCGNESQLSEISSHRDAQIYLICYDKLLPLEQKDLIFTTGVWKEFRKNVLSASEWFIASTCNFCSDIPHLLDQTHTLVNKIKDFNNKGQKKNCNNIFIIEDNMYYRSMRYDWFQIARKYGMGYCQIFLHCPLDAALERNHQRKCCIPDEVIKLMSLKMEPPDPNKHYWEKSTFLLDTSNEIENCKIRDVFQTIQHALDNPVLPVNDDCLTKEEVQSLCSKNFIHQVDHILRRLVGIQVAKERGIHHSKEECQNFSKQVNMARQQILAKIRSGVLNFSGHLIQEDKIESATLLLEKELMSHLNEICDQNKK